MAIDFFVGGEEGLGPVLRAKPSRPALSGSKRSL